MIYFISKQILTLFLVVIITSSTFTVYATLPASKVIDIDGNVYKTIIIGTQEWMAENLKTTRLNDGTQISTSKDNEEWKRMSIPAYCYYENDSLSTPINCDALYNWHVVNTGKLAPEGWHVPTISEWEELEKQLSKFPDYSLIGVKALASPDSWLPTEKIGCAGNEPSLNNSSGFNAYASGTRSCFDGIFRGKGLWSSWWSATNYSSKYAWFINLGRENTYLMKSYDNKLYGFSVRSVRNTK